MPTLSRPRNAVNHDIAFLHTAEVHAATFARLSARAAPGLKVRHDVAPALLACARARGTTPELEACVVRAMRNAASSGASVVACTCSTVGGIAEGVDGAGGRPSRTSSRGRTCAC